MFNTPLSVTLAGLAPFVEEKASGVDQGILTAQLSDYGRNL